MNFSAIMFDIKNLIIFSIGNIFYIYFVFSLLLLEHTKSSKICLIFVFLHTFIYNFYFINLSKKLNKEKTLKNKKETFIATLVHDLKSPTFAQIQTLELILSNYFGKLTDSQKNILTQIKESCEYMKDLIFTILNTYLYDNGQIQINPEAINFSELILKTIEENAPLLKEKNQKITFSQNIQTNEIFADKLQIKRVLTNLITNAIAYGKPQTEIKIHLTENDIFTNFSITNIGKYMPENEIKHIFEKFTSSKNIQYQKTGTKLGLYLTKEIINSHKGKIYAKSTPKGICEFYFSIPKNISNQKTKISI